MVYLFVIFFPQRSHRFLSKVHCTCKHNSVRPASLANTSCEITLQRSVAFTAKPNKNVSISTRTTQLMLGIPFLYSLIILITYFPTDRSCRAPLNVLVARGPFHRRSRPVWTIILPSFCRWFCMANNLDALRMATFPGSLVLYDNLLQLKGMFHSTYLRTPPCWMVCTMSPWKL